MALSKNYLQLEFGSGLFFDYSKEEKDGYVKHTSTKGNVSYRKYFKDGVSGILESVSIYDGKFGQQISMNVKEGDEIYYLPIDIYDQSKQVDNTYAESLIKLLPLLEKGQNVTVTGYNFKPEDSKYSKIGISIKVSGEKLKSEITNSYYKDGELVPGDVPALVWVEKLGKKKPSASSIEAKDEFLLSLLEREEARLTWKKEDNNSEAPKQEEQPKESAPKAQTPAPAATNSTPVPPSEDDDDLPFLIKNQKEMQEEVKNPLNYGYLGDEKIEITAKEFIAMKTAVEQGINSTLESYLPEVTKYVNVETSKIVDNPSQEDLQSGKVTMVTDRDATFNPMNVRYQYSTKLTPDMIMGQQLIMEIHERNVETGVAKSIEELQKASELTLVPQTDEQK